MARHSWTHEELVSGVLARDRRALARAISLVENRDDGADRLLEALFGHTGGATVIGVTGPPGVGKSSLLSGLVRLERDAGRTVGVLSVDPSSPFTQGALLGDRIRMADHFLDSGVYIRSMGTRGHLGGLAETTVQAFHLLDAAGFDVVLVETVGSGQSEVEVIDVADVVVLVLMPGAGDSVQALKAGIMEIPDVIVVNKMDLPASAAMVKEVRSVVALDPLPERRPLVLATDAMRGDGVPELRAALLERRAKLASDGRLDARRRHTLAAEVVGLATARAREQIEAAASGDPELAELVLRVERRELDPSTAAHTILSRLAERGFGGVADAR